MSVYYSRKRKKWRYQFFVDKNRYTGTWCRTKTEAREAEAKRKEEIKYPKAIPIDMDFLDLVNRKLDNIRSYSIHYSKTHYTDYLGMAKRWIVNWKGLTCSQITTDMIEQHVISRSGVSFNAANKDLIYLRAVFNFGMKRRWITINPTYGIEFFPVEKRIKYVPPIEDVLKVISAADPDTQDYLWTMILTMGRMSEINNLIWEDIDFDACGVTLYTRKKRRGNRIPRVVFMTKRLFDILSRRHEMRDEQMPWVFWHRYKTTKTGDWQAGPFKNRTRIMNTLCRKVGVKYFRFHALRHCGATLLHHLGVPFADIQAILGHAHRSTTEIYVHPTQKATWEAMKTYDNAIAASVNRHTNRHTNEKGISHEGLTP
ncbi:MAG TPA: site-specific integrase [Syntrophales bacterium]|nr:site-specific integrase [Syntrophales bacterium]